MNTNTLPALLQVGKNGLTDGFYDELARTLKKKKVVKIKLLRSFADMNETKEVSLTIAKRLGVDVVSVVGNTIVFKSI